jgi:predicted MFS family arabinose efflux permease
VLLVIAAGGATLFGNASGFPELLVARAMIGLGVAGSLMAGLKAIVTWIPRERVALVNGWMIMLGSLGAVTATAPTEWLLELVGWRDLFEVLTIGTVAIGGLIYMVVPERAADSEITTPAGKPLTLRSLYSDPRFLRVAPLSAACFGSSWALHSLWASAWLTDVEGFDRQSRVTQLFLMAVGLSLCCGLRCHGSGLLAKPSAFGSRSRVHTAVAGPDQSCCRSRNPSMRRAKGWNGNRARAAESC